MANNRELSQLGSFINVDDSNRNIGIATTATPYVGIGTTNPQAKLHVVGDTLVNGNVSISGVTTLASSGGISTTGGDLYVGNDLYFKGRFYQNGNLFTSGIGIGSTSKNPGSGLITQRIGIGFTDLNIVGTGISVTGYGSTVVIDFGNIAAASGGALSISTSTVSTAQDITFVGGASTSIIGIATVTDRFVYVPSTGRVGIGSSAPAYKLDVNGDINSSTALKVGGVNVLDEAVRLAIALG